MTDPAASDVDYNPDQQIPMPFAAADAYAQQVMRWAHEAPDAGLRAGSTIVSACAAGACAQRF
jgi:hypothetical protein